MLKCNIYINSQNIYVISKVLTLLFSCLDGIKCLVPVDHIHELQNITIMYQL